MTYRNVSQRNVSWQVVYVAAVLPYMVLVALLIRGSLLPGAVEGVKFYLIPQWHKLLDWQVYHFVHRSVFKVHW